VNTPTVDGLLEVLPIVEPGGLVRRGVVIGPRISYRQALWMARAGRLGIVWLPTWAVCVAHFPSVLGALAASLVFTAIWKLAFRHAYADASVTIWNVGPSVAAALGAATGALGVLAVGVWIRPLHLPQTALLELACAVLVASAVWETVAANSLAARRRVLVVGTAGGGTELLEDVSQSPGLPFEVIAIVDEECESDQIGMVPLYGIGADLARIVEWERPQIVVLANDRYHSGEVGRLIDVGHLGFSVVSLAEFYEYAFGRLPVRSLTPDWFLGILNLYRRPYSRLAKRTFDLIVAGAALLCVMPLLPIIALLVRRTPGPAIFRQKRLGEGGKPFTVYKFRTMRDDAEASGQAVWAAEHDPRVTPVGRYLRNTRLDELPQLWNVLRGEMSIVGPRPERPEFMDDLQAEVPFWSRRHLVRPGITGWAQVRRGYTDDTTGTCDKLSYDLWYLRHRSLVLDVAICAKTLAIVITGTGAR
jgi:exopolysaccharide biosynthesis polyprenyl glycosylphosphotransferase